jgi:hypothetical protein
MTIFKRLLRCDSDRPCPAQGDGRRGDYDGVSLRTGEADKASEAVFVIDESETGRVANSQIGIKRVL